MFGDPSRYVLQIDLYIEHYEHLRDTVKQLHHIAPTENQQIRTKHAHFCVSIFAPMLLNAFQTLINHFNPKVDSEMSLTNYQVFFDFWIQLYIDIYDLFCLIAEQTGMRPSEKYLPAISQQAQASSAASLAPQPVAIPPSQLQQPPPPATPPMHPAAAKPAAVQSTNSGLPVPSTMDTNNQIKFQIPEIVEPIADQSAPPPPSGYASQTTPSNYCANCCTCEQSRANCCNRPTNGLNPAQAEELARKRSLEENEIVEKAKTMTQIFQTMLEFTNGTGTLKTTQDLFTTAESFGDEANKFYKIVRYLTYQVSARIGVWLIGVVIMAIRVGTPNSHDPICFNYFEIFEFSVRLNNFQPAV